MKKFFRWITAGVFLLLTALLVAAAKYLPDLVFPAYSHVSRWILSVISKLSALFPFPLWEVLLAALILGFFISLLVSLCKGHFLRWLSKFVLFLSEMVFLFVALWGLNYYAPSINEQLALPETQYTVAQLKEAACYYRDMANLSSEQVQRDATGQYVPAEFQELAQAAGAGFESLALRYDCFHSSTAAPKKLLSSPLLAKTGTTGIFICYTAESGVSTETYPVSVPFTMCHEVGHRMAFAREDEANFAAFLACMENERADFQYSGYYNAFLYCYNALYKVDKEAAREVLQGVNETLSGDLSRATEHYAARRSETASQVTDKVYDTYLKSFSVKEGVQSYGEVADLLLIWYYEVLP